MVELTTEFLQRILKLDESKSKVTTTISQKKKLATLWKGYGEVFAFTVEVTTDDETNHQHSNMNNNKKIQSSVAMVSKHVNFPSDYKTYFGWERRIRSYHIEAYFYNVLAPVIHPLVHENVVSCPIATHYYMDVGQEDDGDDCHATNRDQPGTHKDTQTQTQIQTNAKGNENENGDEKESPAFTFILSDLSSTYNDPKAPEGLNRSQTLQAIQWLAAFHAVFYNHPSIHQPEHEYEQMVQAASKTGNCPVWREGGYWCLKERDKEYNEIPPQLQMYKHIAQALDERLHVNRHKGYFTIIHGDFKMPNMLFRDTTSDSNRDDQQKDNEIDCAVVDFQYCGHGYGVKDLVMLLVTAASKDVLESEGEDALLEYYAKELQKNLHRISTHHKKTNRSKSDGVNAPFMEEDKKRTDPKLIKMQYQLALVDYTRFISIENWVSWGSNPEYAQERSSEILKDIMKTWSGYKSMSKNMTKSSNTPSTGTDAVTQELLMLTKQDWKEAIYEKYPLDLF